MADPVKIDPKKIEQLLLDHPELLIAIGLLCLEVLAVKESKRPTYLKDMPPIHQRTAGAWRGKGPFGKGFGPNKVSHK